MFYNNVNRGNKLNRVFGRCVGPSLTPPTGCLALYDAMTRRSRWIGTSKAVAKESAGSAGEKRAWPFLSIVGSLMRTFRGDLTRGTPRAINDMWLCFATPNKRRRWSEYWLGGAARRPRENYLPSRKIRLPIYVSLVHRLTCNNIYYPPDKHVKKVRQPGEISIPRILNCCNSNSQFSWEICYSNQFGTSFWSDGVRFVRFIDDDWGLIRPWSVLWFLSFVSPG